MRTIILCGVLFTTVCANVSANPSEPSKDLTVRAEYALKTPRTREPVLGGSKDKVAVTVWIPSGVKTVRGAVCNPFSKGEEVSKHWQAACRQWKFAYVQVDFDAVKKDEFSILKTGLNDLAKESQHPELAHVPLCFLGMSRGGGMSMQLTELMPERTIASAPVCLEVGPESDAARRIPAITIFGEKDGSQMEKLLTKLPVARKQNSQWAIAVQWNRKHEFGQANNLAFVFFDDVISRRVPRDTDAGKPVKLAELTPESGWLGDTDAWSKTGTIPAIAAWKDYKGDRDKACWFPSHRVAATWQAFVSGTKDVTIAEPAGLGDGQAFALRSATKPITVKLTLAPSLKPTKVELWNGNERLAEKTEAPWVFDVTLKPGVHALHAVVIQKDADSRSSRPHAIVVGD